MTQEVLIQFSPQDQGVIAYLAKQNSELLKNQERLIKIGEESKKANKAAKDGADSSANAYAGVGAKLTALAAGYLSVGNAISFVTEATKKQIEASDEAALKLDTLRRAAMVATNLRGKEAQAFASSIEKQSMAAGVNLDVGYETAIQMASSGFSNEQITGGGLRDFLNIQTAQRLANKEADATGVVSSTTQLLNAQGKPATGENVRALGVAVQNLKDTPLVFADLQYLAKEMAALKEAGLTDAEALTSFAQMRNTISPMESGSGLRNIAQRLAGANAAKDRVAALKELGLTPDDVNMVGESFTDVLQTMRTAFQNVPEEKKNGLLQTLFESAGVAPAAALMKGREQILGYQGRLTDPTLFNADVAISQGGLESAKTRQQVAMQLADAAEPGAGYSQLLKDEILQMSREQGVGIVGRTLLGVGYDSARLFGASPEQAAGLIAPGDRLSQVQQVVTNAKSRIEGSRTDEELQTQNTLVREQNTLLEKIWRGIEALAPAGPSQQTPRPRTDPGTPPAKRPSSALAK